MLSSNAPVGRPDPIPTAQTHFVNGQNLHTPPQNGLEQAMFGMGCFFGGVERIFWQTQGVHVTAVGYSGGQTPNPTYQEVCTGQTAHNEVVWLTYDPKIIPYSALLQVFWQGHNPTQGMRQGNDRGTQYRSGIYTYSPEQVGGGTDQQNHVSKGIGKRATRHDYHRNPARRAVLLRRGLSSAVFGEKPCGLLRNRRVGRGVPLARAGLIWFAIPP